MDLTDRNDDDLSPRQAAEIGWGRRDELSAVHIGLNRRTWRVGHDLWLTAIDVDRADLLHREHILLHAVRSACARANLQIQVPEVVATTGGDEIVRYGGSAFRATAHIDGVRPDDNDADTYLASARTLRELHPALRIITSDLAVLEPGLAEVRRMLSRCVSEQWEPITADATERATVYRVAEWLAPRLARLEEAPSQLVHGDWATPNLLINPRGRRVVGILDWQLCSDGPVIADIAHAVSGALMWSRLAVQPVVDAMFDIYGDDADRRLLGPAMAAYWFRNYWWNREEIERDARHCDGMERQPGRLRSVMSYVQSLGD